MHTTSIHLLDRARHREDQAAWSRFVTLYSPLLLRWARKAGVSDHDALDLVQDVFVILLRELPGFDYDPRRGSFRAWLWTLTVRQATARRRRWDPVAASHESASDIADETPAENRGQDEYRQLLVRRALELMKVDFEPATWQACWEHTVSGRSAADVGRQLGLSEGAVYVAKSRVLRRLREELQGLLD